MPNRSPVEAPEDYPTESQAAEDWERLAAEMSALRADGDRQRPREAKGSLLVLGSGIQSIGFTRDAEIHIRAADKVFFCVADPPTVGWIRSLRPDAYDLYVLYEDGKPRYYTYVQMTEAMLHYVRAGLKVVAVYYGHPGIFVLSTHRAIRIARREGHHAVMRPAVSALDCLCADLGVDPAQPGLQTHEATDLLIRRRRLDPSLHVVLWQVGLIGEMGYRRKGFLNRRFQILVEYLQEVYGPDHQVTHYISARYPTIDPLIATYELSELSTPRISATFTGISTLYIPPKEAAPVDLDMAISLGLAKAGDVVRQSGPLREIDGYGHREAAAISQLAGFRVPDDYQFQEMTAACRFLIDLVDDVTLQALYRADPAKAVVSSPQLSERERALLVTRQEGAVQLAAKGKVVSNSPTEALVIEALSRLAVAKGMNTAVKTCRQERTWKALRDWEAANARAVEWRRLPSAVDAVLASSLLAWTGVYLDDPAGFMVTVVGSKRGNKAALVYLGERRLRFFSFANGVLSWEAGPDCGSSGELRFDSGPEWARRATGWIRTADGTRSLSVAEPRLRGYSLASWVGRYESGDGKGPVIDITMAGRRPCVVVDGCRQPDPSFSDGALRWHGSWITVTSTAAGARILRGQLSNSGQPETLLAAMARRDFVIPYVGAYHARLAAAGRSQITKVTISPSTITIGSDGPARNFTVDNGRLRWLGEGPCQTSGDLVLSYDGLTNLPYLYGTVTSPGGRSEALQAIGAATDEVSPHWALRHVSSDPLPDWVTVQLLGVAASWVSAGGLPLHMQWQKTRATHLLLRQLAASLPRALGTLTS